MVASLMVVCLCGCGAGTGNMSGLQWSNQITVVDLLTFVGLLGGLISLVFVYLQLRAGAQQAQLAATAQRGRFLLDVIQRYFDDVASRTLDALRAGQVARSVAPWQARA
jgi:hypothetical protein